ncbi:MAG: hypothetical protein NTV07_05845 [Candidatus Omnitrophica bacterium]|nr:hypothetical protein [Candidatus Omnitrophota bacterium]
MKKNEPGMTLIVKTVTRLTVGLILIYGIYIMLRGRTGPGGGFAGGIIIALSFIHLVLAYGKEEVLKKINRTKGLFLAVSGGLIFLAVTVFTNSRRLIGPFAFSAWLTPLCELAIALISGMGFLVIFLVLVILAEKDEQ